MKYLTNLDLNKNELQNVRLQNLATAPQNPVEGQIYYNTTDKVIYQWDGTAWKTVGGDLPVASASVLGGVKVGGGLSAEADGTLSTNIQTIRVNGAAQTPDANKAIDLVVPDYNNNDGAGNKLFTAIDNMTNLNMFIIQRYDNGDVYLKWQPQTGDTLRFRLASTDYVDENGGKIDKIKVNGVEQTITNKEVDLSVPEVGISGGEELSISTPGVGDEVTLKLVSNGMTVAFDGGSADTLVSKTYADGTFRTEQQVQDAIDATVADFLELAGGTMQGEIAMGNNAITGLAAPTNSSDAATKGYVDALTVGALVPAGSYAFASLPAPSADTLHKMYNVTDAFTATANFIDTEVGLDYPAGTNVAVVNVGTAEAPVYKYDALTGIVDLSSYPTKTEVNDAISVTTSTLVAPAASVTVSYTGTLIETYATQGGVKVIVDEEITSSTVKFSCATAPTTPVSCVVVTKNDLS